MEPSLHRRVAQPEPGTGRFTATATTRLGAGSSQGIRLPLGGASSGMPITSAGGTTTGFASDTQLMPVLDLSKTFLLEVSESNRHYRGEFEDEHVPFLELALGRYRPSSPLVVRRAMGGPLRDAIELTSVFPYVVSDRFREVLVRHDFRGWITYPVELYDKAGKQVSDYHALCITGRCGPVRRWRGFSPSRILLMEGRGLHVDARTWDGSDLFVPEKSGWLLVLEPVMQALRRATLSGLHFEPIREVVYPLV